MKQNVKKLGNFYEKECCKILADNDFWVHLFAYNQNGQPCDIVALKKDLSLLIDVKHCDSDLFSFNHIQYNQLSCFELASQKNIICGFAIYFKNIGWRWLSYTTLKMFFVKNAKSVRYSELNNFYELKNK